MDWGSRASEYARLLAVRESLRREGAGSTSLSQVGQQLHDLVSTAAAALCGYGDEVPLMLAALAEPDGAAHWFAANILVTRKQFPRVYVEPLVSAGLIRGQRGDQHLLAASHAWGPVVVWELLAKAVDSDSLTAEHAEYLCYYVRARKWAKDTTTHNEQKRASDSLRSAIVASKNRALRRVFRY